MKASSILAAVIISCATAGPAVGHHAFAAQWDCFAPVTLTGKISLVEWINPHAWIHITVSEAGKAPQAWMVETVTPNSLRRLGLGDDVLKPGAGVTIRGYLARDRRCPESEATHLPTCKADGRVLTLDGGKGVYVGCLGDGAPHDADAIQAEADERRSEETTGVRTACVWLGARCPNAAAPAVAGGPAESALPPRRTQP